jgi:hypothetical protein
VLGEPRRECGAVTTTGNYQRVELEGADLGRVDPALDHAPGKVLGHVLADDGGRRRATQAGHQRTCRSVVSDPSGSSRTTSFGCGRCPLVGK